MNQNPLTQIPQSNAIDKASACAHARHSTFILLEQLRELSDENLLSEAKHRVNIEREATTAVIHALREVDERKLFAKLGYSSLFQFAMKELGYSEAEAAARITAARLTRQLPAIEEKIETGNLSLTQIVKAAAFFAQERKSSQPLTTERKLAIFKDLEGKSTRESEKHLLSLSTNPAALSEKTRTISPTEIEIRVIVDQELMNKLTRLKEIWSHALPQASWQELIARMAEIAIEKEDPIRKAERATKRAKQNIQEASASLTKQLKQNERPAENFHASVRSAPTTQINEVKTKAPMKPSRAIDHQQDIKTRFTSVQPPTANSISDPCRSASSAHEVTIKSDLVGVRGSNSVRKVPSRVAHAVWLRDDGKCTYVGADGNRCSSQSALELDHVIPFAAGGPSTVNNLRLRCRAHNALAAIQFFGRTKMSQHDQPRI